MYSDDIFLNIEILVALFRFIQLLLILLSNDVQCNWNLTYIYLFQTKKNINASASSWRLLSTCRTLH